MARAATINEPPHGHVALCRLLCGRCAPSVPGFPIVPRLGEARKCRKYRRLWVAGGLGFEPRLTESESAVLPLNYPPISNDFNNLEKLANLSGYRRIARPLGITRAHLGHLGQLSKHQRKSVGGPNAGLALGARPTLAGPASGRRLAFRPEPWGAGHVGMPSFPIRRRTRTGSRAPRSRPKARSRNGPARSPATARPKLKARPIR
jgi:hypothetical protein